MPATVPREAAPLAEVDHPAATATLAAPSPSAPPPPPVWTTTVEDEPEPAPAPTPSRPSRPARLLFGRRLSHLGVVLTTAVVVLGGGFWNRAPASIQPGGTDQILFVPTVPLAAERTVAVDPGNSGGVLSGYISTATLSVTPSHLEIETYTTTAGQTVADVAQQTGRSVETLLAANNLVDSARPLDAGTVLRIPPVDGILHTVHDGDTLESIAARYGVEVEAITGYEPNGVQQSADLVPYHQIVVPGGVRPTRDKVVTYVVREGDALSSIAQRFGLQPSTIVWANDLPNGDLILPGQQLAILPTDGVMVRVEEGDTVESLAEHYGVEPAAIVDYPQNGLGAGGALMVGSYVMIPGGAPPAPPPPVEPDPPPAPAPNPPQLAAAAPPPAAPAPPPPPPPPPPLARATGSFIWPATGVITQYFHGGHNGWDIANRMYTPLYAADGGTVIFSGWNNYGLGYTVAIDHGNGFVTWYGHMAEHPPVRVGQRVAKGEYIGPMGSTGNSTGPHIHFIIVRNGVYQDPALYLR